MHHFRMALAAVAAAGLASAANAGTVFDTTLPNPPGVYFGTGNFNTGYAVTTGSDGLLVGLKSKIRGDATDSVQPVGDVYSFALGQIINYDFAIFPASSDFKISSATISLLNVGTGQTASVDALVLGNQMQGIDAENSEQLKFFWTGFDPTHPVNATYDVTLTATDTHGVTASVTDVIKIGAGVPEPAIWGLMILGLGGIGGVLRRNHKPAVAPAMV